MEYSDYGDFRARREATVWQRLNRVLRALLVIAIVLVLLFIVLHLTGTLGPGGH